MPRGFGRLPLIGRLLARGERSPSGDAAAVRVPIDPDLVPLGQPVLLPTAIISQVLFEATELVPAWAMPRATPEPTPQPTQPKATTRPRKPRATKPAATKAAATKPAPAKPRRSRVT